MQHPTPPRFRRWSLVLATILGLLTLNLVPTTASAVQGFTGVNTPTVTGSGVIGTDFTASLDVAGTTPAPTTITYTWYRPDTPDPLQTGASNTLTASSDLEGTPVYVVATLAASGIQSYITLGSSYSATVHKGSFQGVNTPSVSGSGIIGTDFTASLDLAGTTPVPSTVTYSWYRVDSGDPLQSSTETTFTAVSGLEGTGVYVIATLEAEDTQNYVTVNSPFSNTVRKGAFDHVNTPAITGSGVIGTDFTVSLDLTDTTPEPNSVTYTWYRVDTGDELQSGPSDTLRATRDLEGTGVYVIATLQKDDTHDYVTVNSPFSSTVRKGEFVPGDAPTLSGLHTLYGELIAQIDTATWEPEPTTVSWQWFLADGTAIVGADEATLAMTADLVGDSVYAVATLQTVDTADYVIATPPSGRIAAPTLSVPGDNIAKPGSTVPFKAWGLLFNTEYTFELHSQPIALGTRTSSAVGTLDTSFTLPSSVPSGTHRLVVLLNGEEIGSVAIEVVRDASPVPPAGDTLAHTGVAGETWPVLSLAALSMLGGLVLLNRARHRTGASQ